jgi:hypothetical protein
MSTGGRLHVDEDVPWPRLDIRRDTFARPIVDVVEFEIVGMAALAAIPLDAVQPVPQLADILLGSIPPQINPISIVGRGAYRIEIPVQSRLGDVGKIFSKIVAIA